MDNVQNCDSYDVLIHHRHKAIVLTCWASSEDVMCFLRGTNKPTRVKF
jgi:hypothetical protein